MKTPNDMSKAVTDSSLQPLAGIRVVEFAGIGPGPFAGMMLADHGAEVIRIARPGPAMGGHSVLNRGRARNLVVDLKSPEGLATARNECIQADALIEGFRPGVMERLSLGPQDLAPFNPKLVYGRITGWGQTGPLARAVGHDINYLAVSGALHALGRANERPVAPMNLVADFGGGAMFLLFGLLAALLRARTTGEGCVVDAAMVDGTVALTSMYWGFRNEGNWSAERGANLLDSGAPFYDVYETLDGRWLAVGAIEPQFSAALLAGLQLTDDPLFGEQMNRSLWPQQKAKVAVTFASKPSVEWLEIFRGTDACVTAVPSPDEASVHPHVAARRLLRRAGNNTEPAPAPRYSPLRAKVL